MVPDHRDIPKKLFTTGLFDLTTHEGQGAFVDAVVSALHARDERWGHLKKSAAQTQIHGHGEDSALYLSDTPGQSQAVDFIGGAGGPNPQPGWIVDSPRYSASDWLDPTQHGAQAVPGPPVPVLYPYPDENTTGRAFHARVKQVYADANRLFPDPNDADAFRHFMRYGYSARTMPEPEAADRHIAELRQQLGV
jgi:hypothetical protein